MFYLRLSMHFWAALRPTQVLSLAAECFTNESTTIDFQYYILSKMHSQTEQSVPNIDTSPNPCDAGQESRALMHASFWNIELPSNAY